MSYINNTGDYVESLFEFISDGVTDSAIVTYEDDEPPHPDKPLIILEMPDIIETSYANDGRQQDELGVSILVKVPKNIGKANIVAVNIGGFLRGVIAGSTLDGYLDDEHDCVDEPTGIQGQPIKWAARDKGDKANTHGYEITFSQLVRYGTVEIEPFILKHIGISEGESDESIIYEDGDSKAS